MEEKFMTLEEATHALTATAQRAAKLMREEAGHAKTEAERAWGEIESVRAEILAAKDEIRQVRSNVSSNLSETVTEAERVRDGAQTAWRLVAAMVLVVIAAVGWTASKLTRDEAQIGHLSEKVTEARLAVDARSQELDRLRGEIESARIAQARAEGELRAVSFQRPSVETPALPVEHLAAPTTRPSLSELFTSLLLSDVNLPPASATFPASETASPVVSEEAVEISAPLPTFEGAVVVPEASEELTETASVRTEPVAE